jgi:hypothetical protein
MSSSTLHLLQHLDFFYQHCSGRLVSKEWEAVHNKSLFLEDGWKIPGVQIRQVDNQLIRRFLEKKENTLPILINFLLYDLWPSVLKLIYFII